MRVYNGTKSQVDLPLTGTQRITIPAHSVSGDIMPSTEFLSLLVTSYDYNELALIVSGPFEINLCAGVTGSVGFVVQSLDEAIERFAPKVEKCSGCEKPVTDCKCDSAEPVTECEKSCSCSECKVEAEAAPEETTEKEKKSKPGTKKIQ